MREPILNIKVDGTYYTEAQIDVQDMDKFHTYVIKHVKRDAVKFLVTVDGLTGSYVLMTFEFTKPDTFDTILEFIALNTLNGLGT